MDITCSICNSTDSPIWHKSPEQGKSEESICNSCFEVKTEKDPETKDPVKENSKEPTPPEASSATETKTRKSTRSTRFKSKAVTRQKSTKSVSRRSNIFKSQKPFKTPSNISAETRTKTNLFVDGFYYQIGDIVAVMSRGKKYYAQIRALMVDTFCEKSAVLTWLIPTTSSPDPNEEFDPATYLVGLEEDIPRRIKNTMEFVMHAPSDYFYSKTEPYAKPEVLEDGLYSEKNKKGFVWQNVS